MGFIPDLGVSKTKENNNDSTQETMQSMNNAEERKAKKTTSKKKKSEKKIVSYNLEVDLVDKLKKLAREKNMYYSTLVSHALKRWIAENR